MKTQNKKRKLIQVAMYFEDDVIPKQLEKLAKGMGMSVSSAAAMVVRYGLPHVKDAVKKITKQDEVLNAKSK